MVDELEREIDGTGQIIKINSSGNYDRSLMEKLSLRVTPTFIMLDPEGKELWRTVGEMPDRDKVLSSMIAAGDKKKS